MLIPYTVTLAAALGRSSSLFDKRVTLLEDELCDFAAAMAEAFVGKMSLKGRYVGDVIAAYETDRGGVFLYDAADAMWEFATEYYPTESAQAIAARAFALLCPDLV